MTATVHQISEARARRTAKADAPKPFDVTGNIIAFEEQRLSEPEIVVLFQHLLDSGLCWKLQGSYGRAAKSLIEGGYIKVAK